MRSFIASCVLGLLSVVPLQPIQTGGMGHPNAARPQPPEPVYTSPHETQEQVLQSLHEQNLEDTSRLVKLSQELKWDLANHDREVLSLATVRKMDEIERLIRRIRARVGKK